MISVDAVMRQSILRLPRDLRIVRWVRRYGMGLGPRRFVAGESLDGCVRALRRLNDMGFNARLHRIVTCGRG